MIPSGPEIFVELQRLQEQLSSFQQLAQDLEAKYEQSSVIIAEQRSIISRLSSENLALQIENSRLNEQSRIPVLSPQDLTNSLKPFEQLSSSLRSLEDFTSSLKPIEELSSSLKSFEDFTSSLNSLDEIASSLKSLEELNSSFKAFEKSRQIEDRNKTKTLHQYEKQLKRMTIFLSDFGVIMDPATEVPNQKSIIMVCPFSHDQILKLIIRRHKFQEDYYVCDVTEKYEAYEKKKEKFGTMFEKSFSFHKNSWHRFLWTLVDVSIRGVDVYD
ncbi:hypothetical protein RCL1_008295 [Eukaryota sp. TZLM3-RCL]